MKSWHLISVTLIAAAALSFYNNDFKLSGSIIAYIVIAIVIFITNRNKKQFQIIKQLEFF